MSSFTAAESAAMARAIRLADRGRFTAHPNPMVGCVLLNNDEVVGEGWHASPGEPHAEVNALRDAGDRARGATAIVTLEPCAHHGKTPPCAQALIKAGVQRVIAATEDPFPAVAGTGLQQLRDAGVIVDVGLADTTAKFLNRGFFSRVVRRKPFVRLKLACSLDGAVAMADGESQWITGEPARRDGHTLRAESDAILTGIGTVLADDPSLTVRIDGLNLGGRQPLRVVVDSRARFPTNAKMLTLPGRTLVYTGEKSSQRFDSKAIEHHELAAIDGRIPLPAMLEDLAAREVNNLLVESGPILAGELMQRKLVDELIIYQAPSLLGSQSQGLLSTPGWTSLSDGVALELTDVRRIGADLRITAVPRVGS